MAIGQIFQLVPETDLMNLNMKCRISDSSLGKAKNYNKNILLAVGDYPSPEIFIIPTYTERWISIRFLRSLQWMTDPDLNLELDLDPSGSGSGSCSFRQWLSRF
jgi:hypothetical protein